MLQATRLLVFETCADGIFDGRAAMLRLIDASGIGFGFFLPGIALGLLPASRSGRLANGLSVGQNTTKPISDNGSVSTACYQHDRNRQRGEYRYGASESTSV